MATVNLLPVAPQRSPVLSDLLHDYQNELSVHSHKSDDDLRTYKYLPEYFTHPDRTAQFIVVDDEIAGFVLISQRTLVTPGAHSIAEFSVTPRFRHTNVGRPSTTRNHPDIVSRYEGAHLRHQTEIATRRRAIESRQPEMKTLLV